MLHVHDMIHLIIIITDSKCNASEYSENKCLLAHQKLWSIRRDPLFFNLLVLNTTESLSNINKRKW